MNIISANLNIEFINGEEINLELSAMQLKAVCLALGINDVTSTSYNCYSDNGLTVIIEKLKGIKPIK